MKAIYWKATALLVALLWFGLSSCSKSGDEKEEAGSTIEGIWVSEDPSDTEVLTYLQFDKTGVGVSCDVRPREKPPVSFRPFKWSIRENKLTVIFKDPKTGKDDPTESTIVKLDSKELVLRIPEEKADRVFKRTDALPAVPK
ncbi:MAG: lipocalin family protein [Bacteroides sp.]|uniref:lipocalin family protein n=2 Tax=Bacteroides sp. TaxID=29523 RepID=UPI002FCC5E89